METTALLFALLRHAVCGEQLNENTVTACTPDNLEPVYALAEKHDLAHLVAHSTEGLQLPACDVLNKLRKTKLTAIYRYSKQDYEFQRIRGILENAKIPFIPLKGSVLRQYYPEPWMRTSSDIDVLVKEEDLSAAADEFIRCGWTERKKSAPDHDRSFYSATGVHLELHFSLAENMANVDPILDQIWDHCVLSEGSQYEYRQSDDFFLFHHMAHMAHHFLFGGCGLRPILDLWVLKKADCSHTATFRQLCDQACLGTFSDCAMELSGIWFEGKDSSPLMQQVEQYILQGGTFGNLGNKVLINQANSGSRAANMKQRIWQPFDLLSMYYPILRKHRWLFPFFQIVRWFRIILSGRLRLSLLEIRTANSISQQQLEGTTQILTSIGLSGIHRSSQEKNQL